MRVDVAQDHDETTVHTMSPVHGRGPVFYASMPCANETLKGCGTAVAGDKHGLVATLWDHLVATESPLWKRCQSSTRAAFPVQVVRSLLGKPHLLLGEYRGPAISFSEGGGKVWVALCGDESDIGIDVAGTDEFHGEYPFHRVFHSQELQHALRLAGGDLEQASALLWSVKEAVVKALGCAFHLVDPRHITVYQSVGGDGGYTFPVGLSGKALERFPLAANHSLWVRSIPRRKEWLSIALLTGRAQQPIVFRAGSFTRQHR
jgi:phosphopantetheinyl transferase (holo-ACP synthase)